MENGIFIVLQDLEGMHPQLLGTTMCVLSVKSLTGTLTLVFALRLMICPFSEAFGVYSPLIRRKRRLCSNLWSCVYGLPDCWLKEKLWPILLAFISLEVDRYIHKSTPCLRSSEFHGAPTSQMWALSSVTEAALGSWIKLQIWYGVSKFRLYFNYCWI